LQNPELRQPQLDFECLFLVKYSPFSLLFLSFFPQNLELRQLQLDFEGVFHPKFSNVLVHKIFTFFPPKSRVVVDASWHKSPVATPRNHCRKFTFGRIAPAATRILEKKVKK